MSRGSLDDRKLGERCGGDGRRDLCRGSNPRAARPGGEDAVFLVGLTWGTIGVLVFRREITLDLVADFFSGSVSISWRKLPAFVEEDRRFVERETV